jgi:DNA-binding GntR family transcriptional regulator
MKAASALRSSGSMPRMRSNVALSRQVYELLRERILVFELKPFEPISENALALELGVSRSPVREALARLSELGFVDIFPQSGTVIAPLRLADLKTSQFLREALEMAFLRRAMELGRHDDLTRRLRTDLAVQRTFVEGHDAVRFYAADEEFHHAIAMHAGMATMLPEMARAKAHMDRFRHLMLTGLESLPTVLAQHEAIVEAIEAGDQDAAGRALQTHLRRILQFVDKAQAKRPEFFELEGAFPGRPAAAQPWAERENQGRETGS